MTSEALRRALTDPDARPLPVRAAGLLEELDAPPRLAAHLRAVHEVAVELTEWIRRTRPAATIDRDAILFGAATHDIGKTIYVDELSGPGSAHEQAGYELLMRQGVEKSSARFARTHASWTASGIGLDDLVVSLADKAWKAKRVPELEQLVIERLAAASGLEPWEAFVALDDELDRIAGGADRRLAFQAAHPIRG